MKICLRTRTNILNALVRSRAVYACQAWSISQMQLQSLNAAYMSFIRRMTKGGFKRKSNSWSYVHRNEDLLKMAQTISLESFVKKQQLNCVINIINKDNWCIVKRLLFNDNPSMRPGPQFTLLSSVMRSENTTLEQLSVMTNDENRRLIP